MMSFATHKYLRNLYYLLRTQNIMNINFEKVVSNIIKHYLNIFCNDRNIKTYGTLEPSLLHIVTLKRVFTHERTNYKI